MHLPKKVRREDLGPDQVLCEFCVAKCCRYFALPIEAPTTWSDFEYLRWFLMHGQASAFTEGKIWYLMVHTDCKHLQSDHRCGIYETRPHICREYTTDDCEYDDDWVYERYFETSEQVAEYAEAVLGSTTGAVARSKPPALLPIVG